MFENIAAIDIGSSTIKAAMLKTGLRDFNVKSFIVEKIQYTQTEEGTQSNIREILDSIFADEGLKNCKIIVNLPMQNTIIKNITFPFDDVEKIASAIPFEAEENMPFSMDDVSFDFQSLQNENKNEGRIIFAAAPKSLIRECLNFLNESGIKPVSMGLESNGLYESYRYFSTISDESLIQLDIGNKKTILNILKSGKLQYTRSIPTGISMIHDDIAEILKVSLSESAEIFEKLELDLVSFDNNLQRSHYSDLKISRQNLKKIYEAAEALIDELIGQILLTIKSYVIENGKITFSRCLVSGGGSLITGLPHRLSEEFDIPVVNPPFIEGFEGKEAACQLHIALGSAIAYISRKKHVINFLKGEFLPDATGSSRKIYYLASLFIALSLTISGVNLALTSFISAKANEEFNEVLINKFKEDFKVQKVISDPISDAKKMITEKKQSLEGMEHLMEDRVSVLEIFNNILAHFNSGQGFDLQNIILNEKAVSITGTINSTEEIDRFKQNLLDSNLYDSVSLNIKHSRKGDTAFSMDIKLKIDDKTPKKVNNDQLK